ncbi:hypothetical protein BDR07DRAFT_1478235 [Suillus spraguei]|nr:hypothetical protein BDR07DRAFT_1498364 [Suillus spraguei]KAG2368463.1 hypothetical protein BDR07DRAFT_1478235 [Suillus spraguei]
MAKLEKVIWDSAHSDAMHKTDWALKWIPDQRSIFSESSLALAAVEGILFYYSAQREHFTSLTDWALKFARLTVLTLPTLLIDTYIKYSAHSDAMRKTDWALK